METSVTVSAKFNKKSDRLAGHSSAIWALIFTAITTMFVVKVLWGYWERDLTFGDTSSYFREAALWHASKAVNFVWSPLYTAYYGAWLSVSENAVVATFLHRVGLIAVSTGLVAWLAFRTLPKVVALILMCWWIALPIHYDTLYEVHLLGAIPVIVLALIAHTAGYKWRLPLMLGVAMAATVLIRNEFIIAVGIFVAMCAFRTYKNLRAREGSEIRTTAYRYALVLIILGVIIAFFYSASYIKGDAISTASKPKHTLNMCQVYAFGHQQRNPEWTGSPWTGCSPLMQQKFGVPLPSLSQMIASNPYEVAKHFLWNLSLTRGGIEVLLFNATSSRVNPDYAPVLVVPVIPSVLLGLSILIIVAGITKIYLRSPVQFSAVRLDIAKLAPVLLTVLVMALAIIITQRPRPSYLLGTGILYMWLTLKCMIALSDRWKIFNSNLLFLILSALLLWSIPSYKTLTLPSKTSSIKSIYNQLFPHQAEICVAAGKIALGEYISEIPNYLCTPRWISGTHGRGAEIISLASLGSEAYLEPSRFVRALEEKNITALIIDPVLTDKYPGLGSCSIIRDELLKFGWKQLLYSTRDDRRCIAAYTKNHGAS